jgi:hypothetical protein
MSKIAALLCSVVLSLGVAHADDSKRHFDGAWDTILSCTNSNGALGYSFEFVSTVKDGVLHGEKGDKGKPGWLQLDGEIHLDSKFSGTSGRGTRVEGRPCTATFTRRE